MWSLPGGFCEYGENLGEAALREAKEETGLTIELIRQFHTYSDPDRDPRHHTITTVFLATSAGQPVAGDDAKEARVFADANMPEKMAFDHRKILDDYFLYEKTGSTPRPGKTEPTEQ
jgi:ADP-ribose pyrophosphatase YjhB (NUDIX family)